MSETKKEWKLPKNTRQVGDGSGDKKLYVEDYVVTYLNRLSGQKETAKALLLGTVKEQNLYPYVFVDAAIEIEDFRMSEEEKIQLDKQIETEFGIKKVVGWFLSSKEKPVIYNQEVLDIYKQLFQEENQVLLVADSLEDELTAFFMEEEILTEQPGYFIYYEKNVPMQKRLIQTSTEKTEKMEENVEDHAIQRFRKLVKQKKTEKEAEEEQKQGWMTYIAGGFLVMTVLALGVTIVYNYDRMKQVEQSLAILSDHVDSQREYVTDQADSAEAVISHMKNVTEDTMEDTENLTVEEEIVTENSVQTVAETEKNIETEQNSETETEEKHQPEDAVRTAANQARASYTIKVGDTLAGISEMYYGTTEKVQEICALNGISEEDTILPGQKILLP